MIAGVCDRKTEKLAAPDLRADHYVGKPFGIGELWRMRISLRRGIYAGLTAISADALAIRALKYRRTRRRGGEAYPKNQVRRRRYDRRAFVDRLKATLPDGQKLTAHLWCSRLNGPSASERSQLEKGAHWKTGSKGESNSCSEA